MNENPFLSERGYRAFGSFFTQSPDALVRATAEYVVPDRLIDDDDLIDAVETNVKEHGLGAPAKSLFYIDENFTFLNHGAFG